MADTVKSIARDVRNRIFYGDAENLVRDATSNTSDPPSPAQLQRIAGACLYPSSYPLVWLQLHKRLTHLEYKRHVVKALLVMDYLIRLRPPSASVQLKLIADVKEKWQDLYRLARLRVHSSSEDIQQIQRVAERLCEFIWRFEQGDIEAGQSAHDDEEESRRKKKKKAPVKRRKRRSVEDTSSDSSSSSDSSDDSSDDSDANAVAVQREPPKDILSPSRIPNFGLLSQPPAQVPQVSPFGFDFGFWSDPNKNASAGNGAAAVQPDPFAGLGDRPGSWDANWDAATSAVAPPNPNKGGEHLRRPTWDAAVDWHCERCTYLNPSDQNKCVMCDTSRPLNVGSAASSPIPTTSLAVVDASSSSDANAAASGWVCKFCSFINPELALVCHVCDHLRNQTVPTEGGEKKSPKEEQAGQGATLLAVEEHKESPPFSSSSVSASFAPFSPARSHLGGVGISGGVSCSWCQYLNPPGAKSCEVCDRDLVASGFAQKMKLEFAQAQQLKQALANQKANLSWQCVNCTHVNPPGTPMCARCKFDPSKGVLPSQQQASPPPPQLQKPVFPSSSSSSSTLPDSFQRSLVLDSRPKADPFASLGLPDSRPRAVSAQVPTSQPIKKAHTLGAPITHTSPSAAASSSSGSRSAGHSRKSSFEQQQFMPENDLLALIMEQSEGNGGAADVGSASAHKREQSVMQQVAAMSAYDRIQQEVSDELKSGKWQCTRCSYLNFPQDMSCDMCNQPRPSPSNPFDAIGGSPISPGGATIVSPRSGRHARAISVASPLAPKPNTNPFDWLQPLSPPVKQTQQAPAHFFSPGNPFNNVSFSSHPSPPNATPPPVMPSFASASSASTSASSSPTGEWSCSKCTFINLASKSACAMCEQPRDESSLAAPVTQAIPAPKSAPSRTTNEIGQAAVAAASAAAAVKSGTKQLQGARSTTPQDPYSALLAASTQKPASPALPTSHLSTHSTPSSKQPSRSSSPALVLAPPTEQPQRHRGTHSASGSRQTTPTPPQAKREDPFSMMATPPRGIFSPKHGTLPPNFKIVVPGSAAASSSSSSSSAATLPPPPVEWRDSSFNAFDPAFPVPDAFSHLHAGTAPKSPPVLAAAGPPPEHQRQVSFNSLFNQNSDLFAKQYVHKKATGATSTTDSSSSSSTATAPTTRTPPLTLQIDSHSTGGLEVVGEGGDEMAGGDSTPKKKRSKEEKEARKKEKQAKRERKEKKRAEQQAKEAAEAEAKAKSESESVDTSRSAFQIRLPVPDDEKKSDLHLEKQPPSLLPPPLPTTPRPTLLTKTPPPGATSPPSSEASQPGEAQQQSPPPKTLLSSPASAGAQASPTPSVSSSSSSSASVPLSQASHRQKVIEEIKSTEKVYVDALFDVLHHFLDPIKRSANKMGVTPKQISLIFNNIGVLAQFHALFLADLQRSDSHVVEVFVQLSDFLKIHTSYANGYEKSIATINSLRANKKFQKLLEEKRDLLKGRGLMTFLIMPIQRIPRYVLLLRELMKHTPPDHPELEQLTYALQKIERIAEHVNESKRHMENLSKLLDIQSRIKDHSFVLFKPDRRLLREGMLKRLKEDYVLYHTARPPTAADTVEQLVFLFNDMLLWTTPSFDITGFAPLLHVTQLPNHQLQEHSPESISLAVKNKPYSADMVFQCKDMAEREQWMRLLEAAMHTAKESHQGVRILQREETIRALNPPPRGRHARSQSMMLSPRSSQTPMKESPSPSSVHDLHFSATSHQAAEDSLASSSSAGPQPSPPPLRPTAAHELEL